MRVRLPARLPSRRVTVIAATAVALLALGGTALAASFGDDGSEQVPSLASSDGPVLTMPPSRPAPTPTHPPEATSEPAPVPAGPAPLCTTLEVRPAEPVPVRPAEPTPRSRTPEAVPAEPTPDRRAPEPVPARVVDAEHAARIAPGCDG